LRRGSCRTLGVTTRINHEEAFVQAFIVPDKQSRYLSLLASRKRRDMFLDRLNHHLDYDPTFAVRVPPEQQTAERIETLLRKRGAPDTCHVISSKSDWDAQDMPLHDALDFVFGSSIGTVLCCIPGRLAYYEAEDIRGRFILSK
jgi:hypothetical protein